MKTQLRKWLLKRFYGTPIESQTRYAYMFFFQRENLRTDVMIRKVMKRVLTPDSCCVDIGCYRGEILKQMVKLTPRGQVFAVEPNPAHHAYLAERFPGVKIFQVALDREGGERIFFSNSSHPARSSLFVCSREIKNTEEIRVRVEKLDSLIPSDCPVALIKMDVEGAEVPVLMGARSLMKRSRPIIIFEHSSKACEKSGHTSQELLDMIVGDLGLSISSLDRWLAGKPALDRETFLHQASCGDCSDFIAYPV